MKNLKPKDQHIFDDKTKLRYLALKCQYVPREVVSTLNKFVFPLEESLKVCEMHNNLYGQAFICSRIRNIDKAVTLYIQIMRQAFEGFIDFGEDKYSEEALFSYSQILELCKKEVDELYAEGLKCFNLFLQFLLPAYVQPDQRVSLGPFGEPLEDTLPLTKERLKSLKKIIKKDIFDDFLLAYVNHLGVEALTDVSLFEADD